MHIHLTGHNVQITKAIREYVTDQFAKLEHHYDHINSIRVVIRLEGQKQVADAKLRVNGGKLFASAENANMYAAIDSLTSKLDRQLLRHKAKLNKFRQK